MYINIVLLPWDEPSPYQEDAIPAIAESRLAVLHGATRASLSWANPVRKIILAAVSALACAYMYIGICILPTW